MSRVQGVVFLINKANLEILYAGLLPETYSGITGLADVDYAVVQDLHQHFRNDDDDTRYLHLGFFTQADALALLHVPQAALNAALQAAWELEWSGLDQERSDRINAQRWRVDRYNDESALDRPHTENITPVLEYIQAIRDLPITNPDPYNIVWPTIPPLPGE